MCIIKFCNNLHPYKVLAKTDIDEGLILPDDDLLHPRFYVVSSLRD
jgi:hypothetical protein